MINKSSIKKNILTIHFKNTKKKILIFLAISLLFGCFNKKQKNNKHYKTYLYYYDNKVIHFIIVPKNTMVNDTIIKRFKLDTIKALKSRFANEYFCIEFLKDGKIRAKGFCDSLKIRVGNWNYYKNIKPYIDIEHIDYLGKEIANRKWGYYKKDTDTCIDNLYYIAPERDTLFLNKRYRFRINLTYPYFSDSSRVSLLLPMDTTGNLLTEKRFFNLSYPVKFDTLDNIETLRKKSGEKPKQYDNLRTAVDITFHSKGKRVLNGILLEKYKKNDSTYYKELFFSKDYYIKDTIINK